MLPAQQRLGPDQPPGGEIDDRLEHHRQLVARDRLREILLEPEALARILRRRRCGYRHVVGRRIADPGQRGIGLHEQLDRLGAADPAPCPLR